MDVMFYEVFEEEEKALRRFLPAGMAAGFSPDTVQASRAKRPPAPLISIRTQSVVPPEWAAGLSGILTRSTGCDHVRGYPARCGYLPCYCARSVAEQAVLLMMALLRRLKPQLKKLETFSRNGLTGRECLNRRALVVGVGNIGREVVGLAKGLGMTVSGVDLVRRLADLEYVGLDEGISRSDVILCCLPLTELTRNLLGYGPMSRAKRGAILVNVGRGEVTPAADLRRLLDEGILGGIGLDVYEDEAQFAGGLRSGAAAPLNETGKILLSLKDREDVLFTPHNAFNTAEALERKARQTCEAVACFLKDGTFPNPV